MQLFPSHALLSLPLPRSLSLTRCVTISLLPFNKLFKCMIDDVAQTRLHLQLQPLTPSARQVPPIDNTLSALHPPPTAHRCIDIAAAVENFCAFCKRVASSRPELPTRANCCLKMRQCNYTNENASSNDFLIQPPFLSPSFSLSFCVQFRFVCCLL